jgi:hypothetical protein
VQIFLDTHISYLLVSSRGIDEEKSTAKCSFFDTGRVCKMGRMNRACIWGGFLSLADFSRCILRNLTGVTKDGSDMVAYYHLGIYENRESFIDDTRRSGGLRAQTRRSILVFTAGSGASLSREGGSFQTRHLLNPVALINREDN